MILYVRKGGSGRLLNIRKWGRKRGSETDLRQWEAGVDWGGTRKLCAGSAYYILICKGDTWRQGERRMAENALKTQEISKAVYTGGKGVITRAYSNRFAHSNRMDGTGRYVTDSTMSCKTT